MRKFKKVQKEELEVVDIVCNKCGKNCWNEESGWGQEVRHFQVTGGYWSKLLGDMNQYDFDLCEKCLWKLIKSFKVPPQMYDRTDYKMHNKEEIES
jgi:hypothetical protein